MKTAISIDDQLLKQADATAHLLGLSRSRLFALAVGDYLERQRREQMSLQLNQVYGGEKDSPEKALAAKMKSRIRATLKDRW